MNVYEAALLLLEHAPRKALPLIRRGLRRSGPFINEMAVIMGLIDRPWSRAELLAVLEDDFNHDLEDVLAIVLALGQSHDRQARQVADEWLTKYNPESIRHVEREFNFNVRQRSDQVAALRNQKRFDMVNRGERTDRLGLVAPLLRATCSPG